MLNEPIVNKESMIISLNVDNFLFEKLQKIAQLGLRKVEINSSDVKILTDAMQAQPNLLIGAGNIISTQQLEDCYQVGVKFASSPGFLPALAQTALIYSIDYLPGVTTLSEAMQVMALGYQQVRPNPANLPFCTLLNKSIPELNQYPAEVEVEDIELYFNIPSVKAVCIQNPALKSISNLFANEESCI